MGMRGKLAVILTGLVILGVVASSVAFGESRPDGFQAANGVGAAPFPVNPHRYDPYPSFKFAVKWDNEWIHGISRVTGLGRLTEVMDDRGGLDRNLSRLSPGLTRYEPIVIERGVTQDREFEDWAKLVWDWGSLPGTEVTLSSFRKDIIIQLRNEAGQPVMQWKVYRAWPSEYVALAGLEANKSGSAIERLTIQHEGWERDTDLTEPVEP
jgi:phage tail-like protein